MKRCLTVLFVLIGTIGAKAQFAYNVTTITGEAYTPLSAGATNLTANKVWDYNGVYNITLPFNVKISSKSTNHLFLSPGIVNSVLTDTQNVSSGVCLGDAPLLIVVG